MAAPAAAPPPAKVTQANAPVISLANFEERRVRGIREALQSSGLSRQLRIAAEPPLRA